MAGGAERAVAARLGSITLPGRQLHRWRGGREPGRDTFCFRRWHSVHEMTGRWRLRFLGALSWTRTMVEGYASSVEV